MAKNSLISKILPIALLALIAAPPAMADDSFAKGTQAYNAKDYRQAETYFSETVKAFPSFWPGHYYLGHTYLALGKHGDARKEYEACMSCQPAPGADVLEACRKTISALGGTATAATPASAGTIGEAGKTAETAPTEKKEETYRERSRRENTERLRKQCEDKVASLRQEMKQAIAAGDASSSRWTKTPEGGYITQMNDAERSAIEHEYQDKINQVQADTERHIKDLN